jgi:hypothetical protein
MSRIRSTQLTTTAHGHTIANRGCWSADGLSILYDARDDETRFDGTVIERVMVDSGKIERLYESAHGAHCGVPTCSPVDDRFVFIHGDEHPDQDWSYCAWHRRGAVGRLSQPGAAETLDARDIVPPFTAGALRGGTHLHTFNADATAVLSTYEDHVLATSIDPAAQANRRGLAVSLLHRPVTVPKTDIRNHNGIAFTVCIAALTDRPRPGSDDILMATGEAWLGGSNYVAFQGTVLDSSGKSLTELFLLEMPADLRLFGEQVLAGTPTTRPGVPAGATQRRLTYTSDRVFPGLAGPRHWAVSSPDGQRIGFYMRDENGQVQFWTVSPAGGDPVKITSLDVEPTSPFTWHPDGSRVALITGGSVMLIHINDGRAERLTPPVSPGIGYLAMAPTHHACVFSPDGSAIAFMQPINTAGHRFNQIHVVSGW